MLVQSISRGCYGVAKTEFPRYDTPTDKLIRAYLYGTYNINKEAFEALLLLDGLVPDDYFKILKDSGEVLSTADHLDKAGVRQRIYSEVTKHFARGRF